VGLLRSLVGAQVRLHFGAPAPWPVLEHMGVMSRRSSKAVTAASAVGRVVTFQWTTRRVPHPEQNEGVGMRKVAVTATKKAEAGGARA
jgi:hypothetical protein